MRYRQNRYNPDKISSALLMLTLSRHIKNKETKMITIRQKILASITRYYPLKSGCLKVANLGLFKKITGMQNDPAWADVPGGKVKARTNELIGRTVFYLGDLDKRLTWISTQLINPGDIVVDAGANIGIMTLLFAKLSGKHGKVYSFEPNPLIYKDLRDAIQRSSYSNISSHMLALGEEQGELILSVPESNLGLGTLIRASSEKCCNYNVAVTTLSEFASLKQIKQINLLKIDVEGFEHKLLLGTKDLLKKSPPDFIIFELNNFKGKAKEQDVIKLLKYFNYKFISIPKCLFKMYTTKFNENMNSVELGNDLIAIQPHLYPEATRILNTR
jgi:FkbM family methyltransferase